MSDLVLKVNGVIGDALMRGDDTARAAIKSVAEWLDQNHHSGTEWARRQLLAQLTDQPQASRPPK